MKKKRKKKQKQKQKVLGFIWAASRHTLVNVGLDLTHKMSSNNFFYFLFLFFYLFFLWEDRFQGIKA